MLKSRYVRHVRHKAIPLPWLLTCRFRWWDQNRARSMSTTTSRLIAILVVTFTHLRAIARRITRTWGVNYRSQRVLTNNVRVMPMCYTFPCIPRAPHKAKWRESNRAANIANEIQIFRISTPLPPLHSPHVASIIRERFVLIADFFPLDVCVCVTFLNVKSVGETQATRPRRREIHFLLVMFHFTFTQWCDFEPEQTQAFLPLHTHIHTHRYIVCLCDKVCSVKFGAASKRLNVISPFLLQPMQASEFPRCSFSIHLLR